MNFNELSEHTADVNKTIEHVTFPSSSSSRVFKWLQHYFCKKRWNRNAIALIYSSVLFDYLFIVKIESIQFQQWTNGIFIYFIGHRKYIKISYIYDRNVCRFVCSRLDIIQTLPFDSSPRRVFCQHSVLVAMSVACQAMESDTIDVSSGWNSSFCIVAQFSGTIRIWKRR